MYKRIFSSKKTKFWAFMLFIVCGISAVFSFIMDYSLNKERYDLLKESTLVDCRATSVRERGNVEITDSGRVRSVRYSLTATYEYGGKKCVLNNLDEYDTWDEASKNVGKDRQAYVKTEELGVAGISAVCVPNENIIFKPISIIFSVLFALSSVALILCFINVKENRSNDS